MYKIITICLVWFPLLIFAQSGDKNFIDQNYIEVTGKAELELIPDQIFIKIILNEKDSKNKVSLSQMEKDLVTKLKEIGINVETQLAIKDISSNFKSYLIGKSDVLVAKEYQLIVSDGKTACKVFVELEKVGISNVSIDKLDHSKISEHRQQVKIEAIRAAKEKAQNLAQAIGQNAGRAIYIQELDRQLYVNQLSNAVMYMRDAKSNNSEDSSAYSFEFEKIKLEYSILTRFELK